MLIIAYDPPRKSPRLFILLESVATHIVEKRRDEFTKRLWSAEMTMEDIEALDEDHEGGGKFWVISYCANSRYNFSKIF